MPSRLKRYYGCGHLHFITFSCYQRRPLLEMPIARDFFEVSRDSGSHAFTISMCTRKKKDGKNSNTCMRIPWNGDWWTTPRRGFGAAFFSTNWDWTESYRLIRPT